MMFLLFYDDKKPRLDFLRSIISNLYDGHFGYYCSHTDLYITLESWQKKIMTYLRFMPSFMKSMEC